MMTELEIAVNFMECEKERDLSLDSNIIHMTSTSDNQTGTQAECHDPMSLKRNDDSDTAHDNKNTK